MLAAQDTFGGFGPLIFLAFLVCFIVGYATMAQLQRMLRERHPAVYDSLGQPTLFWNNSPKNSFAMLGFILSGRFMETHDPEVIRLCRFIRCIQLQLLGLFHRRGRHRFYSVCALSVFHPTTSNQSLEPTAPWRSNFSELATAPCRGLSLSR